MGWGDQADGGKRLRLKVRSLDFASEYAACATKLLNKATPYGARELHEEDGRWYSVKVTSLLLYQFVTQPFTRLAPYIQAKPLGFLRGFFTAEGHPTVSIVHRPAGEVLCLTLCVSCTCKDYILFARDQLHQLGYHPTSLSTGYKEGVPHPIKGVLYKAKATEWQFHLARLEEIERFVLQIGFADREKESKAKRANELLKRFGARNAPLIWRQEFSKIGRKWTAVAPQNNVPLPTKGNDCATLH